MKQWTLRDTTWDLYTFRNSLPSKWACEWKTPPRDETVRDDILRSSGKLLDFISSHSVFKGLPVNVTHFVEPVLPEVCRFYNELTTSCDIGRLTLTLSNQFLFKIICIRSSQICRNFPLGSFTCILLSSPFRVISHPPLLQCAQTI
jgi:hypothetical protein